MSRHDWYRRSTWSKSDQAEFFDRLARSRSLFHKAQYVRIQAHYLEESGLIQESLDLLIRLLAEWPSESELPGVYCQKASCHIKLGDLESATAAFRQCFKAEEKGAWKTSARLDFLWMVATNQLRDLYEEARQELVDLTEPVVWPAAEYQMAGALALISNDCGHPEAARRHATAAIEAAGKERSEARHHRKLGLVKNPDPKIFRQLERLASRQQ